MQPKWDWGGAERVPRETVIKIQVNGASFRRYWVETRSGCQANKTKTRNAEKVGLKDKVGWPYLDSQGFLVAIAS